MRYFFFAASYNLGDAYGSANFNISVKRGFPTIKELNNVVLEHYPNAKNIVTLSICELSKKDIEQLLSETK